MNVQMTEEKKSMSWVKPVRYVICIFLCILSIFPFYVLLINATLDSNTIVKGIHLIPGGSIINNYKNLMDPIKNPQNDICNMWESLLHSLIVTVPTVILQVYFASFTAYGVTVYNFKFKKLAWGFIYAIMMIPTQITIIGLLKVSNLLHMDGTYLPLIIPAIAAPTTVYFMKQYMESGFSVEIVEAARIDGAGEFKIFNIIALPLLKPAMATQAIFAFVASWNNLYTPQLVLGSAKELSTMPMYVAGLQAQDYQRDYGMIYLGLLMTVIPIMVAYFLLSKYIVAGVALGGVKE